MSGLIGFALFSGLLAVGLGIDEYKRFDDYSVFRLIPRDESHLEFLRQIASNDTFMMDHGIDFWKYPLNQLNASIDVMLSPEAKVDLLPLLLSMDMDSRVMIDNVQR